MYRSLVVVLSLVGYFFYLVTVFTMVMVLLLRLSDVSTIQKVHHYQRPLQTIAAAKVKYRRQLIELAMRQQVANPVSSQSTKTAAVVAARTAPKTNNHSRQARLDVSKLFGQPREKYEHRNRIALGYADEAGYRPGLDGQRWGRRSSGCADLSMATKWLGYVTSAQ